jgi:hypothetical protein
MQNMGIIIIMYWKDHNPPHFHAKYGDYNAIISLNGALLEGYLPKRVLNLINEWIVLHQIELQENWLNAASGKPLKPIAPLV